ncbi:hypothetical protein ERO13_A04G064900v2 [Gossypium hirsutum]|uniref:60S acidic ribosomal protein P2A isoform X1 n=2 Tax=Gossypium TaxID=3633 RepID=A0ABM3BJN9_GOSHI|nr:60S acidic ribosomal protein P2A-like isoform X1 [Gossypium hirsutum]KAG4204771.1 hypothetical protein ERO13_A04G064900v2 [Gossypium hirsutum]TYI32819.1 hypothetical protein ES332_A04G089200v1 [Gossypium tomentosum]
MLLPSTPVIDSIHSLFAVKKKREEDNEVGAEADDDKIQLLLSEMKGKDVTEIIASGREKLASVPCGGGGVVAAAPGASAAAGTPAAAEAKKEEKVEEKAESSDDDMGFSLFD